MDLSGLVESARINAKVNVEDGHSESLPNRHLLCQRCEGPHSPFREISSYTIPQRVPLRTLLLKLPFQAVESNARVDPSSDSSCSTSVSSSALDASDE